MKAKQNVTIIFLCLVSILTYAQEFQKNHINYQGVASDDQGAAMANSSLNIQIALKFGNANATASYIENHAVTTDGNGLFNLQIGDGTLVSGNYDTLSWGTEASFLTISLNGLEVGTSEFVAVPFALTSADNQWKSAGNNIQNKNTGTVSIVNDLEIGNNLQLSVGTSINEFSTDGTLTGNSDLAVPTEQAVKTYIDNITLNSNVSINDLSDARTTAGTSVFLGNNAGAQASISDGLTNVGVGVDALSQLTIGYANTAVGYSALHDNTGNSNTAIGNNSLSSNTSGSGNVALGYDAGRYETGSNTLYIANSSTENPLIYGEFDTQTLKFNATAEASSLSHGVDLILGGSGSDSVGDNGIMSSDPLYSSSDIFMLSNDDIFIRLDNNDDEDSQFAIRSGEGVTIFEVNENGDSKINGELQRPSTGNANLVPIAYGTINDDGTIINGTGNFTASLDAAIFTISVNDENLTSANTVCSITPRSLLPRTASFEFSANNDLLVITYDSDNNSYTPTDFQFVIYKL
ncbi:hypothetical protein [Psychroserpens damuponensis]|uniref:hypothetical protein n=1 Tax=Psychroserpens damuponensis TaxID=943936 RepID=UPI00058FC790|nr:hypothetical protein [Psychroserpens damuponensis]